MSEKEGGRGRSPGQLPSASLVVTQKQGGKVQALTSNSSLAIKPSMKCEHSKHALVKLSMK